MSTVPGRERRWAPDPGPARRRRYAVLDRTSGLLLAGEGGRTAGWRKPGDPGGHRWWLDVREAERIARNLARAPFAGPTGEPLDVVVVEVAGAELRELGVTDGG